MEQNCSKGSRHSKKRGNGAEKGKITKERSTAIKNKKAAVTDSEQG